MTKNSVKPVVRFVPSPTGNLHVGGARTALFNWLYACKMGGKALLRIEDTDGARSQKEYEQDIINSLDWLGLDFETPDDHFRQSERGHIYEPHIKKMLEDNSAYISKEPSHDDPSRDIEVIRLRNPGKTITFEDIIRGQISFDTKELGDLVIARSVSEPLYHLAVVIDDHEMSITHVIRGEEHISNTPRQILIQEAIGAARPVYAHIPLILAPDRSKLSKRHGASSVMEYQKMGVLPEAFINYLALLGWNPGDDKEVFNREELIEAFSLENIQKGGAIFGMEKLNWLNKEHVAKLSSEAFLKLVIEYLPEEIKTLDGYDLEILKRAEADLRERINIFLDITNAANRGEFHYMFEDPQYEIDKLNWRDQPDINKTKSYLEKIVEFLTAIPEEDFSHELIKSTVWDYSGQEGRGHVLWPMRYALTGLEKSPDPFVVASIIGKSTTVRRLEKAIGKINQKQ